MIFKILTVTAMATFETYAALGTAMAFGLGKWTTLCCLVGGGVAGVFLAAYLGDRIEKFINKTIRKNKPKEHKTGFIYNLWSKYGLYGLGVIGTFLFGAPAAIGVGVGFNADMKKLVPICLITVVARCVAFTFFSHYIKGMF